MSKNLLLAVLVMAGLVLAPVPAAAAPADDASQTLRDAVTVDGVRRHQAAFQRAADANGGTRAASTPGYDASADYVQSELEAAGYDVQRILFEFEFFEEIGDPSFEQTAPNPEVYVDQTDYDVMTFSPSGTLTGIDVTPVDLSLVDRDASTSGCEPEDFDDFVAGTIALIQRGACSFAQKATNAEAAGALGAIIFNQGNTPDREGLLLGTLGGIGVNIPTIGATFAVGEDLASGATVSLETQTFAEVRETTNVVAQTRTGGTDDVVVLGAHLDSVPEGPGVQDNGTGSGAILELALQLQEEYGVNDAGSDSLVNAVRFGWWGAEEFGLLGSIDYVNSLTQDELDRIGVYLNFDMIGSPNFVRFVYDGDGSDIPPTIGVPPQSAVVEQVFLDYFDSQGLQTEATVIGQRSDHFAFCVSGIACGGLFTGAEGIKTAEQAAIYGGTEGEQYDPCYHVACDDFDNISLTALDQMSDAAAHALATYAFTPLCNGLPATIVGTDEADDIEGTPGDDVIVSLGGPDLVNGRGGNDTICLGDGRDTAFGDVGDDWIEGGDRADRIEGNAGDDTIAGGNGADDLDGGGDDDTIDGGVGADTITGGGGDDAIAGGTGQDQIMANGGADTVDGGDGIDSIDGGGGDDVLGGGAGPDTIFGAFGDDLLDGGDGNDGLFGGAGTDTCLNGETLGSCESLELPPAALAARQGAGSGSTGGGGASLAVVDHHHQVAS